MTAEQRHKIGAYIESCAFRSMKRGVWDCALFVADVVEILTGADHGEGYRGNYADRDGALKLLPCDLRELPLKCGLEPSPARDGAVFWSPSHVPEGALGIWWQGRALIPCTRGLMSISRRSGKLIFYYPPHHG